MKFICLLLCVCGSLLKETFVCLGFVSYPTVLLRVPVESNRLLASSSFYRNDLVRGFASTSSDETHAKVSRIIQSILKSPRKTSTEDILRTVSSTDGRLSTLELLELMHGLLEKRDHERFGDVISIYTTSYHDEIEGLLASDQLNGESLSLRLNSVSQFKGSNDRKSFSNMKQRSDSLNGVGVDMNDDESTAGAPEDIDLNLLMLVLHSIQQMKPKKRHLQSLALLDKVIHARLHHQLVSTFIFAIIESSDLFAGDTTTSSTLHNLAKKYFDSLDGKSSSHSTENAAHSTRSASIEVESMTSDNHEIMKKTNNLLLKNLIPSETIRTATALTRPWKNVEGIITEYKQHNSWRENAQKLDVITCLNIVDATLLDKYLNLLVIQKLSVIKSNNSNSNDNTQSLLAQSLEIIRFLLKSDTSKVLTDANITSYSMQEKPSFDDSKSKSKYVCHSSSNFDDVLDFIRCRVGNGCSRSGASDSLFFTDHRLQTAIDLTQLNRNRNRNRGRRKYISNNENEARSLNETGQDREEIQGIGSTGNEIIDDNDNYEAIEMNDVSINRVTAHTNEREDYSCSYYNFILDSISPNTPLVSTDLVCDSGKSSGGVEDVSGCERVVRVLSLGDGDLSFSASLIKIQEQLEVERGIEGREILERTKEEENAKKYCDEDAIINEEEMNMIQMQDQIDELDQSVQESESSLSILTPPQRTFLKTNTRPSPRLGLTVTTFESFSSLTEKYSNAESNVDFIVSTRIRETRRNGVQEGVNGVVNKLSENKLENTGAEKLEEAREYSQSVDRGVKDEVDVEVEEDVEHEEHCRVMYNMDATNLKLEDLSSDPFDVVIFNFPFGDATAASTVSADGSTGSTGYKGSTVASVPVPFNFDTHWVARGRHMHLMEGTFRSVKNILRKTISSGGGSRSSRSSIGGSSSGTGDVDELGDAGKESYHINEEKNKMKSNFDRSSDESLSNGQCPCKEMTTLTGTPYPKLMITLLLSQAMAWEVEKMSNHWGFKLVEIIPFEDRIFSHYGYDRKRTYTDDIFPSSSTSTSTSTFTSTSTSTSSSSSSRPTSTSTLQSSLLSSTSVFTASSTTLPLRLSDPLSPDSLSNTATPTEGRYTAHNGDDEHTVRVSKLLYNAQRKHWERNSVTAWTFVFTHSS